MVQLGGWNLVPPDFPEFPVFHPVILNAVKNLANQGNETMQHQPVGSHRALRSLLLAVVLFAAGGMAAWATEDPGRDPLAGPASAPVAPWINVARVSSTNNAVLSWEHMDENDAYQVWRGTAPYFDPAQGQGNQIAYIPAGPYGSGAIIDYTDDGVDRYADDGSLPTVQVIGDPATNYFWVVRGQNGEGVSENSNRVGEFDFALVAGS